MYEVALNLLKEIENRGFKAYIVGGYPRDKYLGIESNDIDICTSARVEELELIFDNIENKKKKYGNCIIYYNDYKFEVTTFRKEKYLNNRNDVDITFIDSLDEDLNRRDFTINTLCIDKDGEYIDLKDSIKDINNKIVKLIGDIDRLKDDPLRILRAIRFSGNLNFKLDNYLIEGIKKYGYLIKELKDIKIKEEIFKMNEESINLLKYYNLDKYIEKI